MLIVLLVALAGIPAWAPVVLTRAAPVAGHRVLTAVGDWTERHGRQASVVLLTVAALFFLARGTTRLLG